MAGVAFALRDLVNRDDVVSVVRGYLLAGFVSTGPWIFTILALALTRSLVLPVMDSQGIALFHVILVYNFAFSLVFTAPIVLITTRFVADCVYKQTLADIPGVMMKALLLVIVSGVAISGFFYGVAADLSTDVRIAAVLNYCLVAMTWVVGIFLSVLRGYVIYALAFCAGMLVAAIGAWVLGPIYGTAGLLYGFNAGLVLIVFSVLGRTLAEYPYPLRWQPNYWLYFRRYPGLALYGLLAAAATWADKWVMWWAPEAQQTASIMRFFNEYDHALFLVYLTIIPGLTYILVALETGLEERIRRYYHEANGHSTYATLQHHQHGIQVFLAEKLRTMMIMQGTVSAVAVLLAPTIVPWVGGSYTQVAIFQLGVLAAFFHVLVLFLAAVLTYLDLRRTNLLLQLTLVFLSIMLSAASLHFGYRFYGLGYLAATLCVFVASYVLVERVLRNLPFYTYIVVNVHNRSTS